MYNTSRLRKGVILLPIAFATLIAAFMVGIVFRPVVTHASGGTFIGHFKTVSTISSTVPQNGDVNPYGVAVVQRSIGKLQRGDILVSNFNNKANLQGTGTTIVQISPGGALSLFARINPDNLHGACPGGVGLTTALVVLQRGWVIVGSLPTKNGMAATAKAGCLIVLDSWGRTVETFSGAPINGPWDMTAADGDNEAALFVTNVLNGTVAASPNVVHRGTVLRLWLDVPEQGEGVPQVQSITVIGSGFPERTDPAALVIGPTGVGLGRNGTLFVADSLNNRIAAIPDALTRQSSANSGNTVTVNGAVNDPLGLTIAPNGDTLVVNGNNGNIVETEPDGDQVAVKALDTSGSPPGAGCLFGLAVVPNHSGVYFVDDCTNTLNLFH
jgi:sugar lactone lactonase YvrE